MSDVVAQHNSCCCTPIVTALRARWPQIPAISPLTDLYGFRFADKGHGSNVSVVISHFAPPELVRIGTFCHVPVVLYADVNRLNLSLDFELTAEQIIETAYTLRKIVIEYALGFQKLKDETNAERTARQRKEDMMIFLR